MSSITQELELLFSKPLPSTRSGAFYNTFPYPTKISPESIAVYIACLTCPGDTILDSFAGSGSTGIAALLCEHPTPKMIEIANEFGVCPRWGKRNAILYEIGTYASFATRTLTNRLKSADYTRIVNSFISKAEALVGDMYTAKDPKGNPGTIRYVIWSEALCCPNCNEELDYFKNGTSRNPVSFKNEIVCPHCHTTHSTDTMSFVTEEHFDRILGTYISRKKRRIAWVYGTTNGENWDRPGMDEDECLISQIEQELSLEDSPREIEWGDLHRAGYHYGITHLHHFYTIRNYLVMSKLWKLTDEYPTYESDALKLLLLSYNATHCTLMTRVVAKHEAKDFVLTGAQSGVLYISKLPVEKNILLGLKRKSKPFEDAYRCLENCSGNIEVKNQSSAWMTEQNQSIDFVFTDPPFGDFIPYAEVNQINELWLSSVTKRDEEVIISSAQNKNVDTYQEMLADVFGELNRVIKPNRYVAVVFHAAKALVWKAFSQAVQSADFNIVCTSMLDKTQASFKQVVSRSSVQGDPLFLLQRKQQTPTCNRSDISVLDQILAQYPHTTELEMRHCYSLYIGKCMENSVDIQMDAKQVYEYIANLLEE